MSGSGPDPTAAVLRGKKRKSEIVLLLPCYHWNIKSSRKIDTDAVDAINHKFRFGFQTPPRLFVSRISQRITLFIHID